jgi:hypothetical protein
MLSAFLLHPDWQTHSTQAVSTGFGRLRFGQEGRQLIPKAVAAAQEQPIGNKISTRLGEQYSRYQSTLKTAVEISLEYCVTLPGMGNLTSVVNALYQMIITGSCLCKGLPKFICISQHEIDSIIPGSPLEEPEISPAHFVLRVQGDVDFVDLLPNGARHLI